MHSTGDCFSYREIEDYMFINEHALHSHSLLYLFNRMECRVALNNRSESDIPNSALLGRLQQQLKYYKFRRVQTKTGKSMFYLFFKREQDTYFALRAGKNIKDISLVRYRHHSVIPAPLHRPDEISPTESYYQPVPSRRIVDAITYNFSRYIEKFADKVRVH